VQSFEEIHPETYRKYFEHFNPQPYNPRAWAKAAREAGMKYVVLTAKHHEGFCLWDSKDTDYKVTNTPYGRDLIAPFLEAFRAEGLRTGFYYSLLDWHHPDFTIDIYHPLRNHPDVQQLNARRNMHRYAEYMRSQVRELLTTYAPIDILWCDYSYPTHTYRGLPGKGRQDWESEQLLELVRSINPKIMLNNRLDLPIAADFYTPEQVQVDKWWTVDSEPVVWEACHTFSGSWGYHRDEDTWKSPEQLIQMLVNTVCLGGNLLMNVGPTSLGTLDKRAYQALAVYRDWMALHNEAIYGCTQSDFAAPQDCRLTQKGNKLYVHIFNWPFRHIRLYGLADKVSYARFLHDGSEVQIEASARDKDYLQDSADTLMLVLPVKRPDVVVPVIELTLSA
jgi:alpha-L-fucosidase